MLTLTLLYRRRAQTFTIDILIALAVFTLLFTAMERIQTEVAKDRLEWKTVYDLKMAADDIMTALVDSTSNGYPLGISLFDAGLGIDRLNLIDLESVMQLQEGDISQMFLSRLATTEGGRAFGWRLSLYTCLEADMGVKRAVSLPVPTNWTVDPPRPRCVIAGVTVQGTCEGAPNNAYWDADEGECLHITVFDAAACAAAVPTGQWTEDLANPRCVVNDPTAVDSATCLALDNTLFSWDIPLDECHAIFFSTPTGPVTIDDEHDCEHARTRWEWNTDPDGGRCVVTSVGMKDAFCSGDQISGTWEQDAVPPECVIEGIADLGSCETFCWEPQFQSEPFMKDPDPAQPADPPTGGALDCMAVPDGCIPMENAQFGIVSVNRVVTVHGQGLGVINIEVWK